MFHPRLHNRPSIWKRAGILLGVAALFWGCYRPIPAPEPTLTTQELAVVLKDIHLAEAALIEVRDQRQKDSMARFYYVQTLALHRVDTSDFEQSMNAYLADPLALDSLYKKIIDLLEEERRRLNVPPPVMDPIEQR